MIRGGISARRIGPLLACASIVLAATLPATAGAQSAVDEYTLDIPQAGGSSGPGDPSASASGDTAGTAGASTAGTDGSGSKSSLSPAEARERRQERREDDNVRFGELHGGKAQTLDTSSRSFPEVIADTLTDTAMLPILAALVLITGAGVWRVLRGRGTLTGQAG